jgi:hypothetical protein
MARREIIIEIDEALERKLAELPDVRLGTKKKEWTQKEDAALMKHWPRARQSDVARLFRVSEDSARQRYRFLTRKEA